MSFWFLGGGGGSSQIRLRRRENQRIRNRDASTAPVIGSIGSRLLYAPWRVAWSGRTTQRRRRQEVKWDSPIWSPTMSRLYTYFGESSAHFKGGHVVTYLNRA